MRLIDADEFMENLIYCDGLGRRGLEAILKTLKEQPIAYDISKVVTELEEEKHMHTKFYRLSEYKEHPEIKTRHEVIMRSLDKAIDIVRKGGVE